jgi:transcriptional regulator with XRE-family HTH domain
MKTEFAKNIQELRQKKGTSQRVAAMELGISQALLSHYENGVREPRLAFIGVLAKYYNVSADYLLGLDEGGIGDMTESVRRQTETALHIAVESGGEELARLATQYILNSALNLKCILENPNSPYDPQLNIDIRTTEAELYAAARVSQSETKKQG